MKSSFYNVTEYGILDDGTTDNTAAIRALIAEMEANGGGTLYFPAGKYVSGTIELKSNMTLLLDAGAEILCSEDPEKFPVIDKTVIEGWFRPTRSGFIKALNAKNVAVKGRGTLNGRGYNWWHKYGDDRPRSIEFINCENVLIEGIQIMNSPMWTVHPVCCNNVTIHGISIKNPADSPNTDGINPDACSNVHISDCTVDVGDDCVTLKSGTQNDLYIKKHACENITVTNCTMIHGHAGVVIGSEMSGGVRNVVISNCVFCGTDRGIRIKTRRLRGGIVEDVRISNIIMDRVFCPIVLNCFYRCSTTPEEMTFVSSPEKQPVRDDTPIFRNLYFSNLTVRHSIAAACWIEGLPEMPVDGITMDNISVDMRCGTDEKPQKPAMNFNDEKADALMKGRGMLISNARNIIMRNVHVDAPGEIGVAMKNCCNAEISGMSIDRERGGKPLFQMKDCRDIFVSAQGSGLTGTDLLTQTNCENIQAG